MRFFARSLSRLARPVLAALCGALAASALAADAPAPPPDPAPTPAPSLRGSRSIPLSDLPDERRTVRIVYQGYGPAGAVTPGR